MFLSELRLYGADSSGKYGNQTATQSTGDALAFFHGLYR